MEKFAMDNDGRPNNAAKPVASDPDEGSPGSPTFTALFKMPLPSHAVPATNKPWFPGATPTPVMSVPVLLAELCRYCAFNPLFDCCDVEPLPNPWTTSTFPGPTKVRSLASGKVRAPLSV